jgi:hypothetical protein
MRRFLLVWAVAAVSLVITAALLPSMAILSLPGSPAWLVAAVAALTLGLVNFIVRPIILLAARPFGLVATFDRGLLCQRADPVDHRARRGLPPVEFAASQSAVYNTARRRIVDHQDFERNFIHR